MLRRVSSRRGIDDDVESCFVPTTPARVQPQEGFNDELLSTSWPARSSIDHWSSPPPPMAGHTAADTRPYSPHGDAERPSDITATSSMWSCDGSVAHTIISVVASRPPGDSLPEGGGATSIASSNVTPKTRNRKAILRPGIAASLVASIYDPFAAVNQQRKSSQRRGSNGTKHTPVAEQTQLVTTVIDRLDLATTDEPREQPSINTFASITRDENADTTYCGPALPQRATMTTAEANEAEIRRSMRSETRQLHESPDDNRKAVDLSFAQKYWWAFVVAAILIVGICISMTLIICFVGAGHTSNSPETVAVTSRTTTAPSSTPTSRAI